MSQHTLYSKDGAVLKQWIHGDVNSIPEDMRARFLELCDEYQALKREIDSDLHKGTTFADFGEKYKTCERLISEIRNILNC